MVDLGDNSSFGLPRVLTCVTQVMQALGFEYHLRGTPRVRIVMEIGKSGVLAGYSHKDNTIYLTLGAPTAAMWHEAVHAGQPDAEHVDYYESPGRIDQELYSTSRTEQEARAVTAVYYLARKLGSLDEAIAKAVACQKKTSLGNLEQAISACI